MKKSLLLFGILAFALYACGGGATDKTAQLKEKKAAFEVLRKEIADLERELAKTSGNKNLEGKPVKAVDVVAGLFSHSIDVQGRIDAEESVSVGPQMPGLVKRVYVQAGDRVSAGQVLAEIDADAMVQQLASIKIQRDLAKQVFDRQKNLWDQKIGTEIQFLSTKTQYEALDKQVSAVQEQINMTKITAPISGTIDVINMKAGELAAAGFSSIVIVNTSKLRVKGEIAEGYIAKVKTGNAVQVVLPDANKTLDAKITYAGQYINPLNRTFSVQVVIPSNEKDVVPNMVAVLKITDYSNDKAITAPLSAIQSSSDGKNFIYIVVAGADGKMTAERRDVTYEKSYNGRAEITSGLNAGDKLITEGIAELNNGDLISIK